jgi:sugar lactone lactonase YvrE
MRYSQVRVIGGEFSRTLSGIWIDRQDRLYAAGDAQVKVFDAAGKLLRRWDTSRPGLSVAVSADGHVYVGQAGQVEIFDPAAKVARVWRDEGRLGDVTAIGFARGDLLVGDAQDRSIRRYDQARKLVNVIGKDNRVKGLLIPNGVVSFSVDQQGVIHAANPGKHRVERYALDGRLLGHVGRFDGQDPAGFPGCCNPTNVAVAPSGRVYVTEKAGPRAKVLDAGGALVAVIASGVFDPESKNMGIAVDSRRRVYVADTAKLRVVVFEEAS